VEVAWRAAPQTGSIARPPTFSSPQQRRQHALRHQTHTHCHRHRRPRVQLGRTGPGPARHRHANPADRDHGIRASLQKSLQIKKSADALVEAVSAEDVGKMPDKNLADSLQRLSTVAVRTDYDEAEKVSMRGTNPDMTLIIFNGHTVSGATGTSRTSSRPAEARA
jgi:hypothetical protein